MPELLHNAIIINEGHRFKGWLFIEDAGRIGAIGEVEAPQHYFDDERVTVTDIQGRWLLPGVIDSHVHFREPGLTHKATIYSESRAAAAGGVTSFMEMPNTNPPTVTLEALAQKQQIAAKDSAVNYSFFIGATNDNVDVLKQVDYTQVPGVKLFMGSSTGGMLVDGSEALEQIFSLPGVIMAHCEDEAIVRENMQRTKQLYPQGDAPLSWHPEIRSALACFASTARAVELAKKHDARLHVAHITTAEELELFEAADGKLTCEVCVAHLTFTDEDYATLGTRIKCNPSVKSKRHREALWQGIADGKILTVSTDHAPHTLQEKSAGTITAPSGLPMVQFSLAAMLNYALEGRLTPERVVELMCHNQANLFRIEDRGYLREGYWADIVEVDPEQVTEITPDSILSKCGWSPLEGRTLKSRVVSTRVNGKRVFEAGTPHPLLAETVGMPLRFRPE
ncbi:MAG: dihydroorotase [Muribaculaceae bacterium]|nr:dihydroorotase [Muribaculaceae bacterium]